MADSQTKKPFSPPKLTRYGTLTQLTQSASFSGHDVTSGKKTSSSRRFKEDIQDMGGASNGLLRLRPVTFRFRQPFADGSKTLEYGLIAEEVAEVYPELVGHSAEGQIESVKYQALHAMLLNELQKQGEEIRSLKERLAALERLLSPLAPADSVSRPASGIES